MKGVMPAVPNLWPFGSLINIILLDPKVAKKGPTQPNVAKFDGVTPMIMLQLALYAFIAWVPYMMGPSVADAKELSWSWMGPMLVRDFVYVLFFYLGWHWILVHSPLSHKVRPFMFSSTLPDASQTFHDLCFTSLGILQAWALEVYVTHVWATGKHPSIPLFGKEWLGIDGNHYEDFWLHPVWSLVCAFLVPYFQAFHFYVVHRMMHPFKVFGVKVSFIYDIVCYVCGVSLCVWCVCVMCVLCVCSVCVLCV